MPAPSLTLDARSAGRRGPISSVFPLVLGLGALALLVTPAPAAGTFDGAWSVEVITRQGSCEVYKWRIAVTDGKITDVEDDLARASGGIDTRGRVAVTLTRGAESLIATGSLAGRSGAGKWKSPSKGCSGDWRAVRM